MRLSMSRLATAALCPPSAVLPAITADYLGTASTRGMVLHDFLYRVSAEGVEAALAQVPPEYLEEVSVIELDRLPACKPDQYAAEVALAYNWLTGEARELGRGLNRQYSGKVDEELEIPGTPDVVGVGEEEVVVYDYKTGWYDYGPVFKNWQLRAYALAAARAYGKTWAHVAIIRIREDGSVYYDRAVLRPEDLQETADQIVDLVGRLREEETAMQARQRMNLHTGLHCLRCPAFASCPAQAQLARNALAALSVVEDPKKPSEEELDDAFALLTGSPALTLESAPVLLDGLKRARQLFDNLERSLEAFAKRQVVPLEDGYVYGPRQRIRETIDPDKGAELLRAQYGEEAASAAVEVSRAITKENLKRALRGVMPKGGKITKFYDGALQALRDGGAVSATTHTIVERYKPKDKTSQEEGSDAA